MGYSDKQKSVTVEKLAKADKSLADCVDEFLQLMSPCALLVQLTQNTQFLQQAFVPWVAGTLRADTYVLLYHNLQ